MHNKILCSAQETEERTSPEKLSVRDGQLRRPQGESLSLKHKKMSGIDTLKLVVLHYFFSFIFKGVDRSLSFSRVEI